MRVHHLLLALFCTATLSSEEEPSFSPFTGKVIREKVRLRPQANLNCEVIRELDNGELLTVVGEESEFLVVEPNTKDKAYVYSTYVNDGNITGECVNVRLQPDLNSMVIGQLNTGDAITCLDSDPSSKWIAIAIPKNIHYYVAKEYVDSVGDGDLLRRLREREEQASILVDAAWRECQAELDKPFDKSSMEAAIARLEDIAAECQDIPEQAERATELLAEVKEQHMAQKIAYLEAKVRSKQPQPMRGHRHATTPAATTRQPPRQSGKGANRRIVADLDRALADYQKRIESLQGEAVEACEPSQAAPSQTEVAETPTPSPSKAMEIATAEPQPANSIQPPNSQASLLKTPTGWEPIEQELFEQWAAERDGATLAEFYAEQQQSAQIVRGTISPYSRPIRNKPGDFLIVEPTTNVPIAYLYSTQLDLEELVGKEVTVMALPRSNNDFAFPAYYALSVE